MTQYSTSMFFCAIALACTTITIPTNANLSCRSARDFSKSPQNGPMVPRFLGTKLLLGPRTFWQKFGTFSVPKRTNLTY